MFVCYVPWIIALILLAQRLPCLSDFHFFFLNLLYFRVLFRWTDFLRHNFVIMGWWMLVMTMVLFKPSSEIASVDPMTGLAAQNLILHFLLHWGKIYKS